jgi:hypothetical protein
MAIPVLCRACGWKGTVADVIAGERIACRTCGESLPVPKHGDDQDYEILDEEGKPVKPEPPKSDVPPPIDPELAEHYRRLQIARQRKKPPKKQSHLINARNLMYLGGAVLLAGIASLAVNAAVNATLVYPAILLGAGCLVMMTGYALDQT